MNKSLMTGVGIGVVVAAAAGAVASLSMKGAPTQVAAVEQTSALVETTRTDGASALADSSSSLSDDEAAAGSAVATPTPMAAATAARTPSSSRERTTTTRASAGTASGMAYARVVAAEPVVESQRVAREVCHDEQVVRQKPVKDEKRVAGAALGAIVGGVLGNQVGDGDGQRLATAAGAIAGGVAGSKIQKRVQQGNTETVTERRCETVYDTKEKTVGWDVRYRIDGQVQTVRMDSNPGVGAQLPLRNGQLIAQTGGQGRGTP